LKIATKPLQMETWLLSTAYRKSPAPYQMVPSLTPYDLRFSHNTFVTDDDEGQTERQQPYHKLDRYLCKHCLSLFTQHADTTYNRLLAGT